MELVNETLFQNIQAVETRSLFMLAYGAKISHTTKALQFLKKETQVRLKAQNQHNFLPDCPIHLSIYLYMPRVSKTWVLYVADTCEVLQQSNPMILRQTRNWKYADRVGLLTQSFTFTSVSKLLKPIPVEKVNPRSNLFI